MFLHRSKVAVGADAMLGLFKDAAEEVALSSSTVDTEARADWHSLMRHSKAAVGRDAMRDLLQDSVEGGLGFKP